METQKAPWLCVTVKPGQADISAGEVASQIANASAGTLDASPTVLSTLDGRESRRVHCTPGGDMGEFILALSATDDLTGGGYLTRATRVLAALETISTVKGAFGMATDAAAVERLDAALSERGFRLEDTEASPPQEVDEPLLELLVRPEHVGDRHLRTMLLNPAVYGVRVELVRWAIQSFYRLLWTPLYARRMQLSILPGAPSEQAVVLVQTAHLVAPCFDRQLFLIHPAIVQAERERIAAWLCGFLGAMPELAGSMALETTLTLSAMNARGRVQLELTLDALATDLPVISARTAERPLELFAPGAASATSLGPLLLAKECRALFELTAVDLEGGGLLVASFAAINPLMQLPAVRTHDGVTLGESAAILRFLALRYGPPHLYPATDEPAKCAKIDFVRARA
jgi:hypothetical protein